MKKLLRKLKKFLTIPILENGPGESKYFALEQYEKRVSRMNFQMLCTETGVSHRSFVENNLGIQDLKDLAIKSFCIKTIGSFCEMKKKGHG